MEWVEMTGKTVEEAKERALDALGVDESEAEFEVLEEAKGGLFGLLRAEARVRARVVRTAVRPKTERRERRRPAGRAGSFPKAPAGESKPAATADEAGTKAPVPRARPDRENRAMTEVHATTSEPQPDRAPRPASARQNAGRQDADRQDIDVDGVEVAEDFLAGLLDVFGVEYEIDRREVDADSVELAVTGDELGLLIGPRGLTLAAIQDLTRTAVQRAGSQQRVFVDVAGYREARREALESFTKDVVGDVLKTGMARVLDPMPPADRKVVHDTANQIDGVETSSEGEEPRRRVVISPAG